MGQIHSIGDFFRMVRRRFWLIALVLVLGILVSVFLALEKQKIYEATAVAQIESPIIVDADAGRAGASTSIERRLRLLEQQIMARDNLVGVIKKFDLYSGAEMSMGMKVSTLRESASLVQITDPNAGWGAQRVPTGMLITVSDTDPDTAALLANEFLQNLLDLNNRRQSAAASEQLAFFRAERERVEEEIARTETRIAEFKEQNARFLPAGIAGQRDELTELRSTLLQLDQRLIELESNGTRQRTSVIERQRALISEQQELIQTRIAEIEEALATAPEVERQFAALQREEEQLEQEYSVITQRATSSEMSQALENQNQFERIEILETALVPENPVSGSRKKMVLIGAFASGFLGLVLAFLLEMLRPVIRTKAQLERQLNVKAVVAIPRIETPRGQSRKKFRQAAFLVGMLAAISLAYSLLKDGWSVLINLFQRQFAS